MENQTPGGPWAPPRQRRARLSTRLGQGLSTGLPLCAGLRKLQQRPSTIQRQHLSENSWFSSSLAESSAEGNIFGQLGARRTLAPRAWARGHAHQQRRRLLRSQSGKSISPARPRGWSAGSPPAHGHTEKPVPFLWRPGCWHHCWQLLT